MKATTASAIAGAVLLPLAANAAPAPFEPAVNTTYPYTGPKVPIADWVDQSINGNGKGFPRRVEPPAVTPASKNPTNNVNVISVSYIPNGVTIHYQTPFGFGAAPAVKYGTSSGSLTKTAHGMTETYDRTPPCSEAVVTLCNQYFHNIKLTGLKSNTKYYYQIPAANGTTASQVLSFTTAMAPGDDTPYTMAVLNDMGYTNAMGTHKQLQAAVDDGIAFAWHGGDLSYADDWIDAVLPCQGDYVCYNGSDSTMPVKVTNYYKNNPLPKGEIPDQGGPNGGDFSVIYETNWDLWQQWMNVITTKVPYMTLPGNHEAACAEFDGPGNIITAYLNDNKTNSTAPSNGLNYYSCPPSQRNFTAYSNRFHMPGAESGGKHGFWYSFDYGLVHFVSIDTETDYAYSPSYPFARENHGNPITAENQTYLTDAGPFGYVNGSYSVTASYEQYQWLKNDLESVNKTATPWIVAMGHRPMYSSQTASYQSNLREAFQDLMIANGVDAYLAGHIHWYERMYPLTASGAIDNSSVVNNNTYRANPGTSITHLTNGMAGNIESHSTLGSDPIQDFTAFLNMKNYGFNKVHVSAKNLTFEFIKGNNGAVGDSVTILKAKSTKSTRSSLLGYE